MPSKIAFRRPFPPLASVSAPVNHSATFCPPVLAHSPIFPRVSCVQLPMVSTMLVLVFDDTPPKCSDHAVMSAFDFSYQSGFGPGVEFCVSRSV